MRTPRVSAPLAKHPVTAGLSLTDLHVQEALRVKAGGDSVVLARAAESPLLIAFERARLRALYIGFDLMASDLPFRVAFPVLFHNAFEWFRPARREFPADSVRAGAPLPIFVAAGDRELEITAPSGRKERLEVTANPVIFGETLEAGIHTYKSAGREGRFAVNLFDENESDIGARTGRCDRSCAGGLPEGAAEAGFSLWPLLLGLVLLLLAVEAMLAWRLRLALAPLLLRAGALAALALACVNPKIFQGVRAARRHRERRRIAQHGTGRAGKSPRAPGSSGPFDAWRYAHRLAHVRARCRSGNPRRVAIRRRIFPRGSTANRPT